MIEPIVAQLQALGAGTLFPSGGGADIGPLKRLGVPVLGLVQDTAKYFDYHHTEADTLDKIDAHDLNRSVAAMMLMAYALAEHEETLPRLEPEATSE